ncbi:MAG: aldehyde dehydrogenase family protein [Microbacteriaceae bacterium]
MMSENFSKFYINGAWVEPQSADRNPVTNPTSGEVIASTARATTEEVDQAVQAAKAALPAFAALSVAERIALLERFRDEFQKRVAEAGELISAEVGSPLSLSVNVQAPLGVWHIGDAIEALKNLELEEHRGNGLIVRDPIGVVGMITPWNWPVHQIMSKLAFALAAGCTSILKPSEAAPLNATLVFEAAHAAGIPAGVVNLLNGRGSSVGEALAKHPDVDMISITGSTYAGGRVAELAAPSIKRVSQELGGKSANIILDDAVFAESVKTGVLRAFSNNGQSCDAPTRMLIPAHRVDEATALIQEAIEQIKVGPANDATTELGPVISQEQFDSIQGYISKGIEEGATLIAGGLGSAEGTATGWLVKPTAFVNVLSKMTISQEEIFGPVLSVLSYADHDEAVAIANDSPYGLAAYVSGEDQDVALAIARRLEAGQVKINYAMASNLPFGGYKQSGNGRELGLEGLAEFFETKAIITG